MRALFLLFLAAVAAVGAFGAWFEPGEWYAALEKPAWTAPAWVFGPVWTVLYVLIAVAGWLVWRAAGMGAALAAWIVQLVFNGARSFAMFGAQQIGLAMVITSRSGWLSSRSWCSLCRRAAPRFCFSCPIWLGSATPRCSTFVSGS
mgnify:FL=1